MRSIGEKVTVQGKEYTIIGTHKRSLLLQDGKGVKYKITEERLNRMLSGLPPKSRKAPNPRNFTGYVPTSPEAIIKRLQHIECEMSPENLTCDGEASASYVREKKSRLTAERRALVQALGREPTNQELYG